MTRFVRALLIVAALIVLGAFVRPAGAVIAVDIKFSDILNQARRIFIGKVSAVDASARTITVAVERDVKPEVAAWASAQREAGIATVQISKFRPKYAKPVSKELFQSHLAKQARSDFDKTQVITVPDDSDLAKTVKPGDPVVMFTGRVKGGGIHIANQLHAVETDPSGTPPQWPITKTFDTWWTFPGYTCDMVQALTDLSAGETRLENVGGGFGVHDYFGAYREIAAVNAKPSFLQAGDVNGDGIPDFLVGVSGGVKLMLATTGGSYNSYAVSDATAQWGLAGAKGKAAFFADVNGDGKCDMLLDSTLYVNDGKALNPCKAIAPLPAGADVLAVGLVDVNADGRRDAAVLLSNGQLYTFVNGGNTDSAWTASPPASLWKDDPDDKPVGAYFGLPVSAGRPHVMVFKPSGPWRYALDASSGEAPADFCRLTGQKTKQAHKGEVADKLQIASVVAGHLSSEDCVRDLSLVDFIVFTRNAQNDEDDFALMDRGYGMYFANGRIGGWRHQNRSGRGKPGNTIIWPVAATAADIDRRIQSLGWDELVFATEDGKIFLLDNEGMRGTPEQYAQIPVTPVKGLTPQQATSEPPGATPNIKGKP